jgi:hypothetical protein
VIVDVAGFGRSADFQDSRCKSYGDLIRARAVSNALATPGAIFESG